MDEDYIKELVKRVDKLIENYNEHISRDSSEHYTCRFRIEELEKIINGDKEKNIKGIIPTLNQIVESLNTLNQEVKVIISLKNWLIGILSTIITVAILGILKLIWDNINITISK